MSELLQKYKGVSPTPRGQITVEQIDRMHSRLVAIRRAKLKNKITTVTLYACGAVAAIFTAYNMVEYNRSFDNCVRLLENIEINSAILNQEMQNLNQQMAGAVDYE